MSVLTPQNTLTAKLENHLESIEGPNSQLTSDLTTNGTFPLDTQTDSGKTILNLFRNQFDQALLRSRYELRINGIQIINWTKVQRKWQRMKDQVIQEMMEAVGDDDPNVRLMYHGTHENHIESIGKNGFDDNRIGNSTDDGYFGRGHYFTPHLGYSVAYCEKKDGSSRRLNFLDALDVGVTVKVIVCLVICGIQQTVSEVQVGEQIHHTIHSRSAWVNSNGDPIQGDGGQDTAREVVVPKGDQALPRFIISVTRVAKVVLWKDPNIFNEENSAIVQELQTLHPDLRVFITNSNNIFRILKSKKQGASYRLITSGTEGEKFVTEVRASKSNDQVLVFCMNVAFHQQWAAKFTNIRVTSDTNEMKRFACFES